MAHKTPIGRKASPEARTIAAALLDGVDMACPAPEAAHRLLAALELLASTGWLPSSAGTASAVGRAASSEARDAAQALIDTYGPALRSASGVYCLNPDDAPEEQTHVSAALAGYVFATTMQRFAETGWLVNTEVKLERFMIREDYLAVRPKVKSTKAALEQLADRHPRSIRDLERMVGKKRS